ncbi:hypothetical protein YC2023_020632 [Brassica napus]
MRLPLLLHVPSTLGLKIQTPKDPSILKRTFDIPHHLVFILKEVIKSFLHSSDSPFTSLAVANVLRMCMCSYFDVD